MDNYVLINSTENSNNNITIYFTIPSLNVDSQATITQDIFAQQISLGGFNQLGIYLVELLDMGLQGLLGTSNASTKEPVDKPGDNPSKSDSGTYSGLQVFNNETE